MNSVLFLQISLNAIFGFYNNEKFEKAETCLKDYGFLLAVDDKLIFEQISLGYKNKNWQPVFTRLHAKLKEDPENTAFWNLLLTIGYDQIHIDKRKAANFAKKAFEIDSSGFLGTYLWTLNKAGFFEESEQVMQTNAFKSSSEHFQIIYLWEFHYYKKDYKTALKLIEKHPNYFAYETMSRNYAQLGDRRKLDSINKLYLVQDESLYYDKALVHAILKERDSMYYYLNRMKYTLNFQIIRVNGDPDIDPYRQEERYKALLRAVYIPTDGEQYIPKIKM